MLKITSDILREWSACSDGYKRFNQLFPDGADLKTAADGLHADGHTDWSIWLYKHCRNDERFQSQAINGFGNTGHSNTGDWNTGYSNTGDWNTGDWNTGYSNTGDSNTGDWNTGDSNTGDWNTGHRNTGHRNTGDSNTGDWNTGDRNTGHRNTGHRNTGDWNTGDWNTGFFNTETPQEILSFNRPISRQVWDEAVKPSFIFNLVLTWWDYESEMSESDKSKDVNSSIRGGQLRSRTYHEAWRKAWDETTDEDRRLVLTLPNFDPDVFLEISGIDVRTEL